MNMKKWIIFLDGGSWTVSPPIHLDREEYEKTDLSFEEAWAYVEQKLWKIEIDSIING